MDQKTATIPKYNSLLRQLWLIRSDLILISILVFVTGLYIFLILTDTVPAIGFIILALLWLVYWVFSGHLSKTTPMDLSLVGLVVLLPLNLLVSIDHSLTLPKVIGLALGIEFFYVIVNLIRNMPLIRISILALIFLSLVTALLGLLGIDWSETGFAFFTRLSDYLPAMQTSILEATNRDGINSNTIGGSLTFFVPLLVSLLWDGGAFQRSFTKNNSHPNFMRLLYKAVVTLIFILVAIMLVLTRSRAAWLGAIFGLLVLFIWKDRRFLWAVPILLVGAYIVLVRLGVNSVTGLITLLEAGGDSSVSGRLDAWSNATYLIRDFPITGVGLGTFNLPFMYFYTYITESLQGARYFHAHNMLLSVTVDMGIPALVLYSALLGGFFSMARLIYRSASPLIRALVIGLTCGMLSHQVFGVFDAFSLGKKMGVIMWIYFGLIGALFIYRANFISEPPLKLATNSQVTVLGQNPNHKIRYFALVLISLALWILIILVSITFVSLNVYISLGLATVGGVALGVVLTGWFKNRFFYMQLLE